MPQLDYSERFADDLAAVTSPRVEARIQQALDNIESFGEFGSSMVRDTIKRRFGDGVCKVVIPPFDLIYTLDSERDLAHIEALLPARAVQ